MKKSRFTEEQIIAVLREQEAGMPTVDLRRKHGISPAPFYQWKAKFGGLEASEARRIRTLEAENARLKKLLTACAGCPGELATRLQRRQAALRADGNRGLQLLIAGRKGLTSRRPSAPSSLRRVISTCAIERLGGMPHSPARQDQLLATNRPQIVFGLY